MLPIFEDGIGLNITPVLPLPAAGHKSFSNLLFFGCACFAFPHTKMKPTKFANITTQINREN
jgi:hypothetical protein